MYNFVAEDVALGCQSKTDVATLDIGSNVDAW